MSAKKVFFKNSRNLNLVGCLWQSFSDVVVMMLHGSGSNKKARGLFEPIAQKLQEHGYNVFTFDFSGHGESDDDILTIEKAIDDVHSAKTYLQKLGYKRFAFFGHSLGALAALKAYSSDIETMVLLGALTGPVHWTWEDMCTQEQLQELREKGYVSEIVNDGLRKVIQHDGNLLQELAHLDQKKLLESLGCPALIMHGRADAQERDLLATTEKGVRLLPNGSELKIMDEAEHNFVAVLPQVLTYVVNWYLLKFPCCLIVCL